MEKISIKRRIVNAIAAHPKAVTLGIGLAVAAGFAVAADVSHLGQVAFATPPDPCGACGFHSYGGNSFIGRGM